MRSPAIFIIFCLMLVWSCKNEKESPGIEERNEVKEISALTRAGRIEDFLRGIEKSEVNFHNPLALSEFYEANEFTPVWNNRELREDLYRNIENIEDEGLFNEDYHGEVLQRLLSSLNTNSKKENNILELLLTDSFLQLSKDLATGKLNPKDIYDIWGTPLNEIDAGGLLKKAILEGDIQKALDSVRPHHIVYYGLKKSLKEFKKSGIDENSPTRIPEGKLIRPGESDERIQQVANRLAELGYDVQPDSISIKYNETLQKTVEKFQEDHGLQIDGLLGNNTIANLNLTRKDRYHQILVNLERWRWYPRELGSHYIIINIPDYKLSVVKNGDTVRSHMTMVGTEVRKTPVFSDQVQYIVYNPTWTIPPTIKKNDVIPGAAKDLEYLRKRDIKIYDREGNVISPESIDWKSAAARSYTYRQRAGASNPLGLVKIIYPNQYMIYLHDTPSKDLFKKNARAQSSGCVRVQDALNLSEYLLNDQEKYNSDKISEIIRSGKTTEIPVKQQVNVHHFYWTAFRQKDTTKFIDDIYKLDQDLWNRLKPQDD